MKRMRTTIATLLLAGFVAAPSIAHAQGVTFGVAGTGLFSLESGGGSSFGGMGLVGFGGKEHNPVSFRVDGTVLSNNGTSILGTADIVYTFHSPTSMLHPYLLAGGGIVHVPSLTKPMAKAGAGVDYHFQHRNRGAVLFGEATFDLFFYGGGSGTSKALQLNVGVKFGG